MGSDKRANRLYHADMKKKFVTKLLSAFFLLPATLAQAQEAMAPPPPPTVSQAPTTLPWGEPDVAVVATKAGLMRVPLGTPPTVLRPGSVRWCAVDNRALGVWFLVPERANEENSSLALRFLDLTGALPETVVAAGIPQMGTTFTPEINHGRYGTLGHEWEGVEGLGPLIGLRLRLSAAPKIEPYVICEGDASYYCYEGPGQATQRLNDEMLTQVNQLKAVRLVSISSLAELGRRGGVRRLYSVEPKKIALPKVSVPQAACEEGDCGEAMTIPGTRYLSVRVASSRGDYYHETRQFYDPRVRRFFDPRKPGLSAKTPLPSANALETMRVAPSGNAILMGSEVIDFIRGVLVKDVTSGCGWIGGGWVHRSAG